MSSEKTMRSFRDYFTVKEAAEFLGVSADTLRKWDETGKLRGLRHPVTANRLYDPQTLKALLETAAQQHEHAVYECADGMGGSEDQQPCEPQRGETIHSSR